MKSPTAALLIVGAVLAAVPAAVGQSAAPSPDYAVTFVTDVAPIFHTRCISCHRAGEMAPMSLVTYEESRPWARSIRHQVAQRLMPPWFANPAIGHFANDLRLSEREVDLITRWVGEGAPRGEGPEPAPPPLDSGWRIGTPDLVLRMPQAFPVPAQGIVDYQYFQIPTNLTEDRWVQAMEIHPTDRRAVHHLRVFAKFPSPDRPDTNASATHRSCPDEVCGDIEPSQGSYGHNIASIAVGTLPDVFPTGTAKLLRAGSILTLHVHYVSTGVAVLDQTEVGFVFAKAPPEIELKTVSLAQENFEIPPQTPRHIVTGTIEFQEDSFLWTIGPHTHLRGKSWRFDLTDPDGQERAILDVPGFDFNWQMNYVFREPISLRAGSRLRATAIYDNSASNKSNPDPNTSVRWGAQTTDEMMFASVTYSVSKP